jgi:hypothetical protein
MSIANAQMYKRYARKYTLAIDAPFALIADAGSEKNTATNRYAYASCVRQQTRSSQRVMTLVYPKRAI